MTDHIRAVLHETQLDPAAVQVEITDRIASADLVATSTLLSQLKQLRVSTGIDDYGTGAFSLSQLSRAAVDLLKIDRFLVRNMLSDSASRDVVQLLLTLGCQWKINVLAQGIEKASQCEALEQFGCLLGQGYLLATRSRRHRHPIPARSTFRAHRSPARIDALTNHNIPLSS